MGLFLMKWVRVMSLLFRRYYFVPTLTLTKLFLPILQLLYSNLSKKRLKQRAPTIPDDSFFVSIFIPISLISMNPIFLFLQFDFCVQTTFLFQNQIATKPTRIDTPTSIILIQSMEDFDNTYFQRQHFFHQGAHHGKEKAKNEELPEIVEDAQQFGQQFAQEIGTYEAYLSIFDELKVSVKLPLLKVNDVAHEMRTLINSLDFTSLTQLKLQREVLRKKYQLFKAMTAIKQQDFTKSKTGLDF